MMKKKSTWIIALMVVLLVSCTPTEPAVVSTNTPEAAEYIPTVYPTPTFSNSSPDIGEIYILSLLEYGYYQDALMFLEQLEATVSTQMKAVSFNHICWAGAINNVAQDVSAACEEAVRLQPSNPANRDSRGIARALNGNIAGALEDFTFFIETLDTNPEMAYEYWISEDMIELRRGWQRELVAGRNPIDEDTLSYLRNEEDIDILEFFSPIAPFFPLVEFGHYSEAENLINNEENDSQVLIGSQVLMNVLCLGGAIRGDAEAVMPYCDQAVAWADESYSGNEDGEETYPLSFTSRGIARVILGDLEGAVNDFERTLDFLETAGNDGSIMLNLADDALGAEDLSRWIEVLNDNRYPFSEEDYQLFYVSTSLYYSEVWSMDEAAVVEAVVEEPSFTPTVHITDTPETTDMLDSSGHCTQPITPILVYPENHAEQPNHYYGEGDPWRFDWSDSSCEGGEILEYRIIVLASGTTVAAIDEFVTKSEYIGGLGGTIGAGTWAWKVQAVDDKGQASDWSEERNFYVEPWE